MEHNPNRIEAERLLGIADKLLQNRDLTSSRDFAILAQETEPLLDGSDQILAVVDVLLASERRVNNHPDWYSILQIDRRSDDHDQIKKSYRRLALLLHPDKNRYAYSDHAFKLVADAWAVLSDPAKKPVFDTELNLYSPIDFTAAAAASNSNKLPVRRGQNARNDVVSEEPSQQRSARLTSFWTACPYCYILYEYPGIYESCCLRCQNCKRGFEAVVVPNLPPMVPGQDAYYCCWGFFPMGFVGGSSAANPKGKGKAAAATAAYPTWMPPIFTTPPPQNQTPEPSRAATPQPVAAAATGNGMFNYSGGNSNARPTQHVPVPVAASGDGMMNYNMNSRVTVAAAGDGMMNFSGGNSNSGPGTMPRKRGRPRKFA